MGADFPAAHSMDTEWFAIDRDGQVALFITGEDGSVANGAAEGIVDDILRALGSKQTQEGLDYDAEAIGEELARLGLYVYDDDTAWFSGPYRRAHRPRRALHVDQLPPQLRQQIKAVRFGRLRFEEKDVLQPCEHVEGQGWGPGYVAEDGRTVRAFPGSEEELRQAVEQMRQHYPDEFRKYRFEGLDEGA
jgi:hypothetical protein